MPKIQRVLSEGRAPYTRLLIIAPPKLGKTFCIAKTATKDISKLLLILADEGGEKTLRTNGFDAPVARIPGRGAYQETIDLLIQLSRKCPYDVIAFDSASMLQSKLKHEIMRELGVRSATGDSSWPVFGPLKDRWEEICQRAHDLPVHVVWTAWLRLPYRNRMGGAQLEGAGASHLEGAVDAIVCIERSKIGKDEYNYRFRTKPFYLASSSAAVKDGGQINCNGRLGLPDPMPTDVRKVLEYDSRAANTLPKATSLPLKHAVRR